MTTVSLLILSLAAADAGHQPASRGQLLDFTATWCGPCQQMNPIVSRLKRQGYPVRKVDVDQERGLAQRFNVRNIPTFILVVDGQERMRVSGLQSEAQLRRMLAQIPHDPKPSVIRNPDPRMIASATDQPSRNTRPATPTRSSSSASGFEFPFGGEDSPKTIAQEEPRVIRAKLDQEQQAPRVSVEENPLASSVRVRITNDGSVNYGSGTIIDSKPGKTLILTCGHIFRDLKQDAQIEVDVFTGTQAETFVGKALGYDLDGDVGLLSIATQSPLPVSPVAGLSEEVKVRQGVYSIGCGGGEDPSREDLYVTALNRYLGPDNIECTGVPQQGRSGGGLFNSDGQVVGVCVAADPQDKRGLYAGLEVVHNLLKEWDLGKLIPDGAPPAETAIAKTDDKPTGETKTVAPPEKTAVAKGNEIALPEGLNHGEAEVICIIRPLDEPDAASEVVIINRASSRFVSYLTKELKGQPVPTMHQQPVAKTNAALEAPPFASSGTLEAPPFPHETNRISQGTESVERYRRRR